MMWRRLVPWAFGSASSIVPWTFVARTIRWRRPLRFRASPVISSLTPRAYTLAVSRKLIPASIAASMISTDSSRPARRPNIMHPRQSGLTFTPVRPKERYSSTDSSSKARWLLRRRLHSRDEHRVRPVLSGEDLLELLNLRQVVDNDVWVVRIPRQEILMVALSRIKRATRLDCGDDCLPEHVCLVELVDVGLGDVGLLGICREDRRAILGAVIRALVIELGGIVNRKEDLEQLAVADQSGVKSDLDRFRVPGRTAANGFIDRRFLVAAGIARDRAGD